MLTRKSARLARVKMLIVLPLALVSVLAFSNCKNNTVSPAVSKPEKTGNTGRYKGNAIELEIKEPDTMIVYDHETGKPDTVISNWADRPLTLNGKPIHTIFSQAYHDDIDIDTEPFLPEWETLGDYLFDNLKDDFEKLGDGNYNMLFENIVIDEEGEIAYYDYRGVQQIGIEVDKSFNAARLDGKVHALMYDAPAFIPATINVKPVPCTIFGVFGSGMNMDRHGTYINVENHKAILEKSPQKI